jgi:ribosomal protein S18 acetylase RimI-like enzyme
MHSAAKEPFEGLMKSYLRYIFLNAILFLLPACGHEAINEPVAKNPSATVAAKLDFAGTLDLLAKIEKSLAKSDETHAEELILAFNNSLKSSFPLEIPRPFSTHSLQDLLMKDTRACKESQFVRLTASWDKLLKNLDGRILYHGIINLSINTKVAQAILHGNEPKLTTELMGNFTTFTDNELKKINYISIESFWQRAFLYQSDPGISEKLGTSAAMVKNGNEIVAILEFQNQLISPKAVNLGSVDDLINVIPKTPGYVSSVGRLAAYARFGIGDMMFKEFFTYARANGIRESYLHVRNDNFPAINLYKDLGYKIVANIPNYYRDPSADAHVMLKVL